jgi:hypothetical protein
MGSYLYYWIGIPPPGITPPYANFINEWGFQEPVQQALRPFPQYGYINEDSYLQNVGQASYDALTPNWSAASTTASTSWLRTRSPRR